jgi:hypothetical protein
VRFGSSFEPRATSGFSGGAVYANYDALDNTYKLQNSALSFAGGKARAPSAASSARPSGPEMRA